jgi:peptide/nickel transport system ATP-binding protein
VPETAPILRVERLRIETAAGTEIVDEIGFDVHPGEVLALVGESGCGKTSTALALLGHARTGTRIASGTVQLEGRDLLGLSASDLRRLRGSKVSYVPQDPTSGLNPRHRIGKQLAETLFVHGTSRQEAARVTLELLTRVHLPTERAFLRRYPFELSGGQQQRVAIAMALACKPLVVVLDEPTTGLDVTTQARVLELLRELSAQAHAAFVYVTHDLAVVDELADRVAVMYAGRIIESGSCRGVFRAPSHPYTAMLLASVPRLAVRNQLTGIAGTAPPPGSRPSGCFFEPRCPLAVEHCRQEFPPRQAVDSVHHVRCWRASEVSHAKGVAEHRRRSPGHAETLLVADEVSASHGKGAAAKRAIHGVSFSLSREECLAVVGESGSGKTTLARCVAGLHLPDEGAILLRGAPLEPFVAARTRAELQAIQIVFQNPERSLNPRQTVVATIARPLRAFGLAERGRERREVTQLLELVRLPASALDKYPGELSGGEKQRVAIARALAVRPDVLICDEVTSSLDVSIQAAIVALLDELRREGLALLFVTHNLALVNSIADRVLVLESGWVREYGGAGDVIERPAHRYTQELLAAAPDLEVVG